MFKSISTRFLLIPLVFLLAVGGFFGYVEFKKKSANRQISMVTSAPLTSLAFHLEFATLHFKHELNRYKDAFKVGNKKNLIALKQKYEKVKKHEALLYFSLFEDINKVENYIEIVDQLSYIRSDMNVISGALAGEKIFNDRFYKQISKNVDAVIKSSHIISLKIEHIHQVELNSFLENVAKDEKDMALLSIFIIISSLALVFILIDAVYHFKNNAERAQAAEKTNALFAAALQSTRVGVLISDMRKEDHPVVFINDSFTRLTGYNLSDIHGHNKDFLFGWNTDHTSIASYNRAMNLHETATIDFMLYRQDGTPFWSEVYLSPVLDSKGNLAYYVSLFNDITVFRKTQEDLIHAKSVAEQASAVKTNFLAMMSHEIRTPINGILGVIKLLQETSVSEEQKHLLNIANTSSIALNGIINDILDYAKMEAGKIKIIKEPFSLPELVQSVIDLSSTLLSGKEIKLSAHFSDNIPSYYSGDAGRLQQVLLNLMSNAIKFTDSGSIYIHIQSLMPQEVDGKTGQLLRFEVIDTGIGINPDSQEKLFQEFTQIERSFKRRFGGTGLGLAICKRIITSMDGEIGVESQVGKGSKFWFMLPIQESTEEEITHSEEYEDSTLTDYKHASEKDKILLVEDNKTNRLVVSRYLKKSGLTVHEANNGLEAINMANKENYGLILMDISMPEMDGMEATCRIRTLNKYNATVPIIALTAHVMEGDKERCLSAGMNDYLNKPIDYNALLRLLSRWLKRSFDQTSNTNKTKVTASSNKKNLPIFNESILQEMCDNLGSDGVQAVTDSFLKDSKERVKGFETAESLADIGNIAHTLKSSSGNCGLAQFSKLMEKIELAAKTNQEKVAQSLMTEISQSFEVSIKALEEGRRAIIENGE